MRLSFVVKLQQEFLGRKEWDTAELVKVFLVIRHYHIATGSQGALVLQHVLEVLDGITDGIPHIRWC